MKCRRWQVDITYDNTFYAPNASITIKCGESTWTLGEYQQLGYDLGSKVEDVAGLETMIGWAKDMLQL